MAKKKDIFVTKADGKYTSKTEKPSKKVKGGDDIVWTIVEDPDDSDKLPESAEIQLRFTDSRVVGSHQLTDNRTREISAKVQNKGMKDLERFPYTVWFSDGATVYCMEDPELVMDGDTPVAGGPKKKKVNKRKAAPQRPIRKAKKR